MMDFEVLSATTRIARLALEELGSSSGDPNTLILPL
jgi:hypothetical protein